ncbi:MAG: hypothetical protein J0L57_17085, partial [Burkholderiales bacterium]|nr:hypothetical protein [Burkholderiales bacterium]
MREHAGCLASNRRSHQDEVSHEAPALRAIPAAQVQISLPVQGVLRDVRHAFLGLCIDAGQRVLGAMMEADRVALCGAKGVPDESRRATRGGST